MEKYLTSEQVAQILQVHPFTVLKYLKNGTLKGVKIGRVYRIKESNVEEFLGERVVKTEQSPSPHKKSSQKSPPVEKQELPTETPPAHKIEFTDDLEEQKSEHYYKLL